MKFQGNLVKSHGLPPSRLMVRTNLLSEFEQNAGVEAELASSSGHYSVQSPPRVHSLSQSALVLPVLTPSQPGVQLLHQPPAVPGAGHHAPPAPVPPDGCKVPMPGSQTFGLVAGTSSCYNQDILCSLQFQFYHIFTKTMKQFNFPFFIYCNSLKIYGSRNVWKRCNF